MGRRGRQLLIDETVFLVTTTVIDFTPVFEEDQYCDILIRNIKHYQKGYKFTALGYVIMPTHFHWIVEVNPKYGTISSIMRDIKKFCAWDIMEQLKKNQRDDLLGIFIREAKSYRFHKRKFWMERFDDEVVRNNGMFRTKIEYMHNNPVKAGLVELPVDYKYSSARNYQLGDQSVLFVDTSWFF